jgi:ArsR family transcriptional regulator
MTSPDYREAMITQYDAFRDRIKERASMRLGLYSELLGGRPGSILEVGSGTGWMIRAFQELGVSGTGLEIDETLVSLARKEGADVRLADICRIDPRDHVKYDVVCSSQTLEHLSDPRPAIRNMRDMASKGGLIHLDVPNSASWGARYHRFRRGKKRWGMLEPPHHQMGYYPATLRRLLEDAGLEILRVVEKPTDDEVFGQAILPTAFLPRAAIRLSKWLGHGYLLVGLARVS